MIDLSPSDATLILNALEICYLTGKIEERKKCKHECITQGYGAGDYCHDCNQEI
jgi:hypothetical protein